MAHLVRLKVYTPNNNSTNTNSSTNENNYTNTNNSISSANTTKRSTRWSSSEKKIAKNVQVAKIAQNLQVRPHIVPTLRLLAMKVKKKSEGRNNLSFREFENLYKSVLVDLKAHGYWYPQIHYRGIRLHNSRDTLSTAEDLMSASFWFTTPMYNNRATVASNAVNALKRAPGRGDLSFHNW